MKPISTEEFFKTIFGVLDGYLCIVTIDRRKGDKKVREHYFDYPDDLSNIIDLIENRKSQVDVYFAPFLLTRKRRKKEDIAETPVVWSDGDTCPLENLLLEPSIVVRTSKDKHHFYWKFTEVETPDVGESISKRIAYYHTEDGMDKGGWDLTQLLRVPSTYNHKTVPPQKVSNAVLTDAVYKPDDFNIYPRVEEIENIIELGEVELPDKTAKEILEEYKNDINPRAFDLFNITPVQDWSAKLWELELVLLEGELTPEETFVVCRDAACNKYKRSNRPESHLWKEILRAQAFVDERSEQPPELDPSLKSKSNSSLTAPELLNWETRHKVKLDYTFVEAYTDWAKGLGDAAAQYHPAGAFVILSALLCGAVKLPTSFGTVVPNLWFMILADTTLTRKSTAMDIATDMLMEVDDDALLATDGSIEGLLTALSTRSGRSSLFLRDEITGLIEAITKKEYMAGMMETLTKLYDGKQMKRILRRETIDVREPRLVMFSGGIRSKMMDLLDDKHISTGFLPRFIFITAESDITRLKPIGPPTTENVRERERLIQQMYKMHQHYAVAKASTDGNKVSFPKQWHAELSSEAWLLYNSYEVKMLEFAMESPDPIMLTPMMDRLAKSGLKASVLIAASRMHDDVIEVTELDINHAFYYIEQWMNHTIYIIKNIGKTQDERKIQRILSQIESNPGILRSQIMQRNFLIAREADNLFTTLEQRRAIRRERRGAIGERLYPIG